MHWDHEPRSAAFRPQTPLPVKGARHLPSGVEVPALLRPEGRAPKLRFTESRRSNVAKVVGCSVAHPDISSFIKTVKSRLCRRDSQSLTRGLRHVSAQAACLPLLLALILTACATGPSVRVLQ